MKKNWVYAMFGLLIVSIFVSLAMGRYDISLSVLYRFFAWKLFAIGTMPSDYELLSNIIIDIRLPRIAASVMVGAALSVAGASFQAMFVNPLVSPGILGVLAGASFGAALGIMISDNWINVQLLAFFFGFIAVAVAVGVAKIYGNSVGKTILLVLGGVISSALFSALLSVVKFVADPYNKLPAIVYWLMGSFGGIDKDTVALILIPMLVGILTLLASGKYLNILSLGDDEARSLGVRVGLIRYGTILIATLISALTVVIAGMIGWVGLIIPHVARFIVGPDNKILLPMCAILGGVFLLFVDTFCRTAMSIEIPIGIATSLIGIPMFIIALRGAKKGFA